VATLWGAWRHQRWLFWTLLPLALCMCVSTVWGRYHYVADVLGGIVSGTLGYVIGKMAGGAEIRGLIGDPQVALRDADLKIGHYKNGGGPDVDLGWGVT